MRRAVKFGKREHREAGGLTDARHQAWGALLRSHAGWIEAISRRLTAEGALGVEAYDVLLTLSYAPGGRLRMGQLHEKVTLSRSGLTRLIDRLESKGWVRRELCPHDRRVFEAILTDEGEAERARVWPLHAQAIAEEFGRFYTDDEARQLYDLLKRPLDSRNRAGASALDGDASDDVLPGSALLARD